MGKLTFAINVTLDGCVDHRAGVVDAELHEHFTRLMDGAEAMLFGRVTYEMMESYWPAVGRDETAPADERVWAQKLDSKRKYVVSRTRQTFPWENTVHLSGDLRDAIVALKANTAGELLLGSPALAIQLEKLCLIDEYRLVVHPILAGHGPTLFSGLEGPRQLELLATQSFSAGQMAMHYRKKAY
jgi:dihydrofolate reductase